MPSPYKGLPVGEVEKGGLCPDCAGTGKRDHSTVSGGASPYCTRCQGTGRRDYWKPCPTCTPLHPSKRWGCKTCHNTGGVDVPPPPEVVEERRVKDRRPLDQRCTACEGSGYRFVVVDTNGRRDRGKCSVCGGSGDKSDIVVKRPPGWKPKAPDWVKQRRERVEKQAKEAAKEERKMVKRTYTPTQLSCPWCDGVGVETTMGFESHCDECRGVGFFKLTSVISQSDGSMLLHVAPVEEGKADLPGSTEEEHSQQSQNVVTSVVKPKYKPTPRFQTRKVDDE